MFSISPLLEYWQVIPYQYALTTTPKQVAANNPLRPIIYFSCPSGVNLLIFQDRPGNISIGPQIIIPGGTTMRFTWTLDGPMASQEWMGYVSTGTATIEVTECLWNPER